ncbi:MAG: DUF134 domain-containing protein [Sedimentisphaerales bacterium]|nr:DUF134 domain-containing protein [Sedimentisphaerales bacterium]
MPRPKHCRRVGIMPQCGFFKPQGAPMRFLEHVALTIDEFEAVRLADWEGLYQADAAEQMNISRQTFGRILDSSHKKIADALVHGKALRIEGGEFKIYERNDGTGPKSLPPLPQSCGRRRRFGHRRGQSRS